VGKTQSDIDFQMWMSYRKTPLSECSTAKVPKRTCTKALKRNTPSGVYQAKYPRRKFPCKRSTIEVIKRMLHSERPQAKVSKRTI
jgi:hypothetical protein